MKIKNILPFGVLTLAIVLALVLQNENPVSKLDGGYNYDSGDIAWMLTASALVLIMTPGLAFFYGGMVRKKNVISTMLQSFVSMALITVLWVVLGFSLAFGDSLGGIIGNPTTFFLYNGVWDRGPFETAPTIPLVLFSLFQLKFAIITPALITGAFAERMKFTSYMLFITLFSLFIYAPLAHATWHPDGLLFNWGVLDFAGGTVVHISAGVAALASAMYLKGRHEQEHQPARITYVLLGTGLLWFGWFGFNAGSALGANATGVLALGTTTTASATAAITYILFDALRGKKPTALGVCIGAVVGLVAITPAAGFVSIAHSTVIGFTAAIVSNLMIEWRTRSGIDDTLDVFPSHGVGGMVGMLMTGIFSSDGLYFGHTSLFLKELVTLVVVSALVFGVTMLLLKVTDLIAPMRVSRDDESTGLDVSQHNESL